MKYPVRATVNGKPCEVYVAAKTTLAELLRDELDLLGVKQGCGEGECGACTVILNGLPVSSCLFLAVEASGAEITTIEGVADADGLHPLQQGPIDQVVEGVEGGEGGTSHAATLALGARLGLDATAVPASHFAIFNVVSFAQELRRRHHRLHQRLAVILVRVAFPLSPPLPYGSSAP